MTNKVSSFQISMLFALTIGALFLGMADNILINISSNSVLIAMLIGLVIGLIPVFMYMKINNTKSNLNIFQKNKYLFGNILGNILNLLIIILILLSLISIFGSLISFLIAKYLIYTPFLFIGIFTLVTILIISKDLKTMVRVFQILFFVSLILVSVIELLLFRYIEVDNILPIFTNNTVDKLTSGSLFYVSVTTFSILFLLSIKKDEIVNNKKHNRNIFIFYLIASLSLVIVMFYIMSCYGHDMASIFRYPAYVLLKKIIISEGNLHIENILAFRWIFYMFSLACLLTFSLKTAINEYKISNKIKKVLLYTLSSISLILTYLIKYINSVPEIIINFKNYFMYIIALPSFIILTIIFIRCLFYKEKN